MDVTFIVSVLVFILFVTVILVFSINYVTRIPESVELIELRDKAKDIFELFFGSGGIVAEERVTVDLNRIPVILRERNGNARTDEVVAVELDFDEDCINNAWNNSVRVYDQEFNEMPSRISNQILCSSQYLNRSTVTFITNISANERKTLYVYSANNSETSAALHNLTIVGYWTFDEGSGTFAKDFSSYNQTGLLYNSGDRCSGAGCTTMWGTGRFGNGLQLDGVNDYVNVSDSSNLNITANTLTLSTWVRLNGTGGDGTTGRIISKTAGSGSEQYELMYTTNSHSDPNKFRFDVRSSSTLTSVYTAATYTTTGNWTHVAGVYNGSYIAIFINGTESASSSHSGNLVGRVSDVYIGRAASGGQHFNGTIDEVRIYNTNVPASNISVLGSSDLLSTDLLPSEGIAAVSSRKFNELANRSHDDLRTVVGEGWNFRLEIREGR